MPAAPAPTTSRTVLPSLDNAALALIVDLVRSGKASTRKELVELTGLGRKAVAQRVDQAYDLGLLEDGELAPSEGGRQARMMRFRAEAGHVYGVLIGASEITAAVLDLAGGVVDSHHRDWHADTGPQATMEQIDSMLDILAERTGVTAPWAVGVGTPGPVEFATGRLVGAGGLRGWEGFSARSWLRDHYDAPVWVDNDTNLMAFGEWTNGHPRDGRDLLFLKVGTGLNAGLVTRGRVLRGERGAAGDIGHVRVTDDPVECRCGRTGCLEAVAAGWAILREATERSAESPILSDVLRERGEISGGDLAAAMAEGDPLTTRLVEDAASRVARVTANVLTFINPGVLVIGGGVLRTGSRVLDLFTEVIRERCTDVAGRELTIRPASLDHLEGVVGAGLLAAENILAQPALSHWIDRGSPLGQAALLQRFSVDLA